MHIVQASMNERRMRLYSQVAEELNGRGAENNAKGSLVLFGML